MKNYTRSFLSTAIFLCAVAFLVPFIANATGSPSGLLTFVSPSAGEQIVIGKPYDVKWMGPVRWITSPGTTEAIKNVRLTMTCGDPSKGATRDTVITPSTKNDGLFKWSVPKNLPANNYCKITIASDNGKYFDVSPIFGIVTTTPPPAPTLNVSCSASPNPANASQSVTFTSTVSGGTGVYSYSWSGACTGTNATCGNVFQNAGTYNESLTVNSGSQSKSAACSVVVNAMVGSITVSKNSVFADQNVSPNSVNVKIGSYVIQNPAASTEPMRLTSLKVGLNLGNVLVTNFSALRTSDTTGSGSTPIQPTGNDTFSVNDTLVPGASMTLDIFANTGASTGGTVQTTLQITSIGAVDGVATTSQTVSGQTMTLGTGTIATPTLVMSSTTPSQYIASANGATNASQATYSFVSNNGASTIMELKFAVIGSEGTPSNSITNICVGSICAAPIAGTVDLTGLNLAVPNGGAGITQNIWVSYAPVGTAGLQPGTTSQIVLTFVKYNSNGMATTITPNVPAPTMTLVGSVPTVTVPSTINSGLILGAQNRIGQFSVATNPQGDIKVRQAGFSITYSGFDADPTITGTAFLTAGGSSTPICVCTVHSNNIIICPLGSGYSADFDIPAGQTQTFNLFATVNGSATSSAAGISSSIAPGSGFYWDDTSTNGASGTYLTGELIYGFPTNSYTIHQ